MPDMKYVIHYDENENEGRTVALSAKTKADYIINALTEIGYNVDIISASLISTKGYIKGTKTNISPNVRLIKLPAMKWGSLIQKFVAHFWNNAALFFYLILNVKKDEQIIAYHSIATMNVLKLARKIKKFKLILETEEVYTDVNDDLIKLKDKECSFISSADKYLFSTELLNEKFNMSDKPYAVTYGTYKTEHDRQKCFGDGKFHVLYAGTLSEGKGAATAVSAAEFLPENYHVHILGFGSGAEIEKIKKMAEEVNEKAQATVTYDGCLRGEEFICFMQKCRIGLCPQNPNAEFSDTSFPSKILTYMSNGLRVVSVKIPAIEKSAVGDDIYYYNEQAPCEIAKAIMSVDLNDGVDTRKKINELDRQFKKELKELLEQNA